MDIKRIEDEDELEFAIFCIENVAKAAGVKLDIISCDYYQAGVEA